MRAFITPLAVSAGSEYICAVQMVRQIARAPSKPLMVFDGDCGFCRRWIQRWQRWTKGRVDYLPAQESHVRHSFPEISQTQWQTAVHLIAPDGVVYFGAEAVFRSLAFASRWNWLLRCYQTSPTFARISEWTYNFVARHRKFFSTLT